MAGWNDLKSKTPLHSKFGSRLLAAVIGFFTVFALSYVSTNVGRHQRFPHPVSCTSSFMSGKKTKLHVLLLSYPRSGSSFLGDLLQSHKETFYYFEPLHYFGSVVSSSQYAAARRLLHDLFVCDYNIWGSFPEWAWFHSEFLTLRRNKRYWANCSRSDHSRFLCYNVCFLAEACRNSPVQIIKTIRMSVTEAAKLLEEYKDLNLKIIHLIRDPRGTMHSRQQKDIAVWCNKYKQCSSSDVYCNLLEDDLKNACLMQLRNPDKYILVRYEDLAFEPFQSTERIFHFLGLGKMPEEVVQFLETHTQGDLPSSSTSFLKPPYQTVRNSTQVALEWCRSMNFRDIFRVQRHCRPVLDRLGFKMVSNKTNIGLKDIMKDMPRYCETM